MSPPFMVVDERASGLPSFYMRVNECLLDGARVRLRPAPPGGFDLVRNGAALLATDLDGMPIATFHDLGAAIDGWREMRGVHL